MSESLSALVASLIRTFVPIIVGAVAGWFASANIVVDAQFEVLLGTVLTTLFSGVYYLIVRLFETYVSPKFGWLLLFPKAPVVYSKASPRDIPVAVEVATGTVEIAAQAAADTPEEEKDESEPNVIG
jgi:hypothetical protein